MTCNNCKREGAPILVTVKEVVRVGLGQQIQEVQWCPTCIVGKANPSAFPRCYADEYADA